MVRACLFPCLFLAPLLLAVAEAGCGRKDAPDTVRVEADLFLLDRPSGVRARMEPGGGTVIKATRALGGESRSCVVLEPGKKAVFDGVPVHPGARLDACFGTQDERAVLILDVYTHPSRPPASHYECPAEPGRWKSFDMDLFPRSSEPGGTLRLSFSAGPGGGTIFLGKPRIRSEGRAISMEEYPPIVVEEVLHDLVRDFDRVQKVRAPRGEPIERFPFILDRKKRTEADEAKKIIRAAPDSAFTFTFTVPEGAFLDVAAMDFPAADFKARDPGRVVFSVKAGAETLFSARSDFINRTSPDVLIYDRLIRSGRVDLSPWAGKEVTLSFETRAEGGPPPEGFVYCWWNLQVKRRCRVPRRRAAPDRPNVLFLCIDTLRADHLSCYGYARRTTPNLDRFAERSLLFEQARSASSWTLPATASLLTGLHPNTHGVLGNTRSYLVESLTTLPEYLAAHGITTGAFVANPLVCEASNFDQGFERFVDVHECAEGMHEELFAWLEEVRPFRFFGYVHYMEPHSPYSAPGAFRQHFDPDYVEQRDFSGPLPERWRNGRIAREFTPAELRHLKNLYDGEIFYWDEQFKALLDELEALSLLDRTVIVVTADHGEEFFDHGGLGHGWTLYEELLHVPLLIRLPRHRGGARVAAPVDTAGLFDTVAAIMGCDPPPFTQCKGLLPPDRIPGRYPRLFAATECNAPEAEARWACVFEPPFKYIRDMGGDRCFLFRLDRDPGEHRDLASALSTEAERLRKVLEAWYADTAAAFPGEWQPFTREMEKGFETLGYVDRGKGR